jgi:hypothetical protein
VVAAALAGNSSPKVLAEDKRVSTPCIAAPEADALEFESSLEVPVPLASSLALGPWVPVRHLAGPLTVGSRRRSCQAAPVLWAWLLALGSCRAEPPSPPPRSSSPFLPAWEAHRKKRSCPSRQSTCTHRPKLLPVRQAMCKQSARQATASGCRNPIPALLPLTCPTCAN